MGLGDRGQPNKKQKYKFQVVPSVTLRFGARSSMPEISSTLASVCETMRRATAGSISWISPPWKLAIFAAIVSATCTARMGEMVGPKRSEPKLPELLSSMMAAGIRAQSSGWVVACCKASAGRSVASSCWWSFRNWITAVTRQTVFHFAMRIESTTGKTKAQNLAHLRCSCSLQTTKSGKRWQTVAKKNKKTLGTFEIAKGGKRWQKGDKKVAKLENKQTNKNRKTKTGLAVHSRMVSMTGN